MKTQQARDLGESLADLLQRGEQSAAYARLQPVLRERTKFDLLRLIGNPIGQLPLAPANQFIARIASDKTEGGWVVVGSVLEMQLDRDLAGAFERCRGYIIAGDIWYAADILAEQVPGHALVCDFDAALRQLDGWIGDENHWVRRAAGVSAHYWSKRSQGEEPSRAAAMLDLLAPRFEEQQMEAVKGIGWGLKTLGRYYPDLVAAWLREQVVIRKRECRAIMLHKALTYLNPDQRAGATGIES